MLDLWEELERDVESIGIDAIGASIQECKNQESEVRFAAGPHPAAAYALHAYASVVHA